MATVNLSPDEEAQAAALAGDGSVPEVAAGPPGQKRLDPAVAARELERLERLEAAGNAPDPSAEEKLKEDWRPPRKKKAVSLTGLAIVTTTARRGRKSAAWVDDGGEVSPELKAFVARMMRPPD